MSKDILNCSCQHKRKTNYPTYFEWIQLFVAFSVPVAIALYTFLQNNNEQSIALANREKDLEIARQQRIQDLQMADDQQKANILAAYESFLVNHLNHYGMNLDGSSSAKFVARLKTLTTINQLDSDRKTFLLRSLYEAKLITNQLNLTNPEGDPIISLKDANLTGINFQGHILRYLSLFNVNLTRAKLSYCELSCVHFQDSILIEADLHDSLIITPRHSCFKNFQYTIFTGAIMTNAKLYRAEFISTDFTRVNFNYANMTAFLCLDCLLRGSQMYRTDLSFSTMSTNSNFELANLTEVILHSATFKNAIFRYTKLIRTLGINIKIEQCSFIETEFENCTLNQASIDGSNFSETHLNNITLTESTITNVQFINSHIYSTNLTNTIFNQCIFINVNFIDTIIQNASFLNCTFQQTFISNEQRLKAALFDGSVFI